MLKKPRRCKRNLNVMGLQNNVWEQKFSVPKNIIRCRRHFHPLSVLLFQFPGSTDWLIGWLDVGCARSLCRHGLGSRDFYWWKGDSWVTIGILCLGFPWIEKYKRTILTSFWFIESFRKILSEYYAKKLVLDLVVASLQLWFVRFLCHAVLVRENGSQGDCFRNVLGSCKISHFHCF